MNCDMIWTGIIIPILAAIIGGGLTLTGVAWSIYQSNKNRKDDFENQENNRKEEERKKYVPYIKVVLGEQPFNMVRTSIHKTFDPTKDERNHISNNYFYSYVIENFNIKNLSSSNVILDGIYLNDIKYKFQNEILLERNGICQVQTTNNFEYSDWNSLESLILVVKDILGNLYHVNCRVSNTIDNNCILITSESGNEFKGLRSKYSIEGLDLPVLKKSK